MKKILILTRDFPPYSGRGNVMRILKFAKYLPEFGWQPFIIAEKKDEQVDSTLLEQLPPDVDIEYVYSKTPQKKKNEYKKKLKDDPGLSLSQKVRYFFYRSVGYNVYTLYQYYLMAPDLGLFWAREASAKAIDLHRQHKFDTFLSSGPPFSAFKAGIKLNEQLQIPWVLDFRDGWVGNPIYRGWNKLLINSQNRKLEKEAMAKADLSIFVTEPMCNIYRERYPKNQQRMVTITNGFDSDDYIGIQTNKKHDNILNFIYSGTISGRQVPTTFLKGLAKAISENHEIKQHLRIGFIGKFNYHNLELSDGLRNLIDIHGMLPHRASLEQLGNADVFLLLINPSGGRTMMTGKIFEYLAFKKPIFAVSIPCAATDLIQELNAGYIADFRDEDEIKNQIVRIYDDWKTHKLENKQPIEGLDRFERKSLTGQLNEYLNKIV